MAESETSQKRHETTGRRLVSGIAHGLMDRMRLALGGRDCKAEVAGYKLALIDAPPRQAGEVVDRLLELLETDAAIEAMTTILGVFDRLEPTKRERVIAAGHGLWGVVLSSAALDTNPTVRKAAAGLMGRVCEPETFGPLRHLMNDQEKDVGDAAGNALLAIAERTVREADARAAGPYAVDAGTREAVERLVLTAVREFDKHRRKESLAALLALGGTPSSLRAAGMEMKLWLDDADHPAHMALRGMIRRGDAGIAGMRARAWVWLGQPGYRSACIERVAAPVGPEDVGELAGVLELGHLILNPAREQALVSAAERSARTRKTGAGRKPGLVPGEGEIERLSERAQARLPAWTARVEPERCAEALEPMLCASGTLGRLNALRVAQEASGAAAGELALDFCFDPDARIARAGVLRAAVLSRGSAEACRNASGAFAALSRSEHEPLREIAGVFAAMLDPLSGETGRIAARRMLRGDRAGLVRRLQATVRSGLMPERIAAIRLAGRLGLAADLELELLSLVAHSASVDAASGRDIVFAASAAVMVLAQLSSPAAQHAVHRCLRHPDDRVRANALDAMARAARRGGWIGAASSPLGKAVVEFRDDPHHRVRAGAARAMLLGQMRGSRAEKDATTAGGGAEIVVRTSEIIMPLLKDSRAMHRVSGLWLAERAGSAALAGAIAEMVRNDPEPTVRARARRTAARLLAGMRAGDNHAGE